MIAVHRRELPRPHPRNGSSASGQVGAIFGGLLITAAVAAGAGWINTNLWWGDPHPGLRPAHRRRPERRPRQVGED